MFFSFPIAKIPSYGTSSNKEEASPKKGSRDGGPSMHSREGRVNDAYKKERAGGPSTEGVTKGPNRIERGRHWI